MSENPQGVFIDDVEFPFDLQEIKKEPDDQELQTQNILPDA